MGDHFKITPGFYPLNLLFFFIRLYFMLAFCSPRCPRPFTRTPPRSPVPGNLALALLCTPLRPGTLSASKAVSHAATYPKRSRLRVWTAARRTSYPHPPNRQAVRKRVGMSAHPAKAGRAATGHDVAHGAIGDVGPFRRTSALKHNVRYVPLALPPGLAASCSRTPAHSVAVSAQKRCFGPPQRPTTPFLASNGSSPTQFRPHSAASRCCRLGRVDDVSWRGSETTNRSPTSLPRREMTRTRLCTARRT